MKEPYVTVEAKVLMKADSYEEEELTKWICQKMEEDGEPSEEEVKT